MGLGELHTYLVECETHVPDAADKLADQLGQANEEREELFPSDRHRIFYNRIHWAKFYIAKAGLIDSPAQGRFVASRRYHREYNNPKPPGQTQN